MDEWVAARPRRRRMPSYHFNKICSRIFPVALRAWAIGTYRLPSDPLPDQDPARRAMKCVGWRATRPSAPGDSSLAGCAAAAAATDSGCAHGHRTITTFAATQPVSARRTMPMMRPRAMFARLIDPHACARCRAPASRKSYRSGGFVVPGPRAEEESARRKSHVPGQGSVSTNARR